MNTKEYQVFFVDDESGGVSASIYHDGRGVGCSLPDMESAKLWALGELARFMASSAGAVRSVTVSDSQAFRYTISDC